MSSVCSNFIRMATQILTLLPVTFTGGAAVLLHLQQHSRDAAAGVNVTAGGMLDGGNRVSFCVIAAALCRLWGCVWVCACARMSACRSSKNSWRHMVMKLKPTWVTARWFQFFPARPMHEQQAEEEKGRRAGHANTTEGWRGRQRKHTKETTKHVSEQALYRWWKKKTWLITETFKQNMKTWLWCPWWGV